MVAAPSTRFCASIVNVCQPFAAEASFQLRTPLIAVASAVRIVARPGSRSGGMSNVNRDIAPPSMR